MTESTHTYTATLLGSPNRALSIRGGGIDLDESRAPHVTADLTIALPVAGTLAALDTRMSPPPRVQIVATSRTGQAATVTRTFNLTLRDRDVDHRGGTVQLRLASDEALLEDYAPLADDGSLYANPASLRGVINKVLTRAVPGAALQASPSNDADVTALADAVNLSPNGGFRQNINGWTTGAPSFARVAGGPGVDGITYYARATFDGNQSGGWFNIGGRLAPPTEVPVRAGVVYRSAAWVRSSVAVTIAPSIEWGDGNVNFVSQSSGAPVTIPANTWRKLTIDATAPTGAARGGAYFYRTSGNWPAGATLDIAGHRFSEKPSSPFDGFEFFDADTIDTVAYGYNLDGTRHTRTGLIGRSPESLLWKAGQSAMDVLRPIVQAAGFRLVCDEQRRWTLRAEGYTAPDFLDVRHGVNLIDGADKVSRYDDLWFDAAVTVYTWRDAEGIEHTETDAYALTGSYTRLRRFERRAPYPGPGFSQYAVRRAQGRGREVSATCVSDWRTQAEQPVSIVLDGAPIQTGQTSRVSFNLDNDEMTVTTRTTDTPTSAWVLLPAGQRWIDSPVGASWISEGV